MEAPKFVRRQPTALLVEVSAIRPAGDAWVGPVLGGGVGEIRIGGEVGALPRKEHARIITSSTGMH